MAHLIQILARFLCTMYFIAINITAETDWLQECGKCKCKWSSGKKYGDCKNVSLNRVPTGLSTELQVLDLSMNELREIRKQEFSGANLENLHKLFLRNCSLRDINRDGFKNLRILIEIDLSNNLLKYLHSGVFYGLIKLRTVILNNNLLEKLEDRLFENLDFLHKIEIKENRIHKISLNTFVNLPLLTQIYLDANKLKVLKRESFHNLEKLTSLSLSENPWNCTCDLKPFRDYAIDKNLYTPPTDCRDPISVRNKLWSDIPSDYFACKPKILIPLADAHLAADTENVTLTCRIKGSPTPEVIWYYNKQIINDYERRYHVKNLVEKITRNTIETVTSELTIIGVKSNDKGTYTCVAKNHGGRDQAEIILAISLDDDRNSKGFKSLNILIILCLLSASILIFLVLGMVLHVSKRRGHQKNTIEKGNYDEKLDHSQQSDIEMNGGGCGTGGIGGGGGVGLGGGCGNIGGNGKMVNSSGKEMIQRTANTQEINLIEKPIRRAYVELNGNAIIERPNDNIKTRIDETKFAVHLYNSENGTTSTANIVESKPTTTLTTSVAPPNNKSYQKFFLNENCNTHLPPDLLTLPT